MIVVRLGKSAQAYTHEQLMAMASEKLQNLKGTRQKPAIPLLTLLTKDLGVRAEEIDRLFVLGSKITVLRGDDLQHLDKLVLASGRDKSGKPHHWALAARDEATYKRLSAHMGSRRKGGIYRIDIVRRGEDA
jgi:hypothetical protein